MYLREHAEPVHSLRGVGPKQADLLARLGIETIADLVLHFPREYEDRTKIDTLVDALKLPRAQVVVRVLAHDTVGWGKRKTLKVYVEDDSARAALVCFNRNYLARVLIPGQTFFVSGVFRYKYQEIQSGSFEAEPYNPDVNAKIVPIYASTEGLSQPVLRRMLRMTLASIGPDIEEELPHSLSKRYGFPEHRQAISWIHAPSDHSQLERARAHLIYWELFHLQLAIKRRALKTAAARRSRRAEIPFALRERLTERLPFQLTDDQIRVLDEIHTDLFSNRPMGRLIQGDVGCGKTLVALVASLAVIESGEQVALMAPTELLARQHGENAARMLEPLGISVGLLTGTVKGDARAALLQAIAQGAVDLIVGTHALFSEDVEYKRLGMAIVDEQHRFGVLQRISLLAKGYSPDLLLMTATPIPRTLALTAFGDLEVSSIHTMPAGRSPVITHLTREGNEQKVYERVEQEVSRGRQAYFVYPLIEESAKIDLKHAEGMFEELRVNVFPNRRLALIHSRVSDDEKRERMASFTRGGIDILISTSVVEVGVDVPNATCMVIEHAERFGLSALHQLRGRVGRGEHQSFAYLIYGKNLTDDGIQRLKTMMETTDGFRIAEDDLRIRGPGELLGVRQSGYLRLNVANLVTDTATLLKAREDVHTILQEDPGLISEDNVPIRRALAVAPLFDDESLLGG